MMQRIRLWTAGLLSRGVVVDNASVTQAVLLENVRVEPGADIRRCIIDKNVIVPANFRIGHDRADDEERFMVTEGGVTAIPKNFVI